MSRQVRVGLVVPGVIPAHEHSGRGLTDTRTAPLSWGGPTLALRQWSRPSVG
jgi:hypothetical protein